MAVPTALREYRSSTQLSLLIFGFLSLIVFPSSVNATKHSFKVASDSRSLIGPVGIPFGFLEGGHFELTVFDFELTLIGGINAEESNVEAGFFLQRYKNEAEFEQHIELLRSNSSSCAFDYFRDGDGDDDQGVLTSNDDDFEERGEIAFATNGILLSMKNTKKWKPAQPKIEYTFKKGESGLYFLVYQICPRNPLIKSTFELDFAYSNVDSFGTESYLTAGEMKLPMIFFFYSISYLTCFILWVTNIRGIQNIQHFSKLRGASNSGGGGTASVFAIHHLMSVLLLLKCLSIFFEAMRYHAIRVSGHAEIWSVRTHTPSLIYLLCYVPTSWTAATFSQKSCNALLMFF